MQNYETLRKSSIQKRLSFLFRDAVLYGAASSISQFVAVFKVPILTRFFSTAEYGITDVFAVFEGLCGCFIILGLDSAVARYFYDTENHEEKKQIVSQALMVQLLLGLCTTIVLLLSSFTITNHLLHLPGYSNVFSIVALCLPSMVMVQFSRNLLKWTFLRMQFIIVSVGSTVVVVLLTILFVCFFKTGVKGVFYAELIGMSIFAGIGLLFCRSYLTLPKNLKYLKPMVCYGFPYVIIAVAGALLPAMDRIIITRYLTLEFMGLYAVGFKLTMFLRLPVSAFQTAWSPLSYSIYKEADADLTYNKVFLYYTIMISLIAYVAIVCADQIIIVLASGRYLPGKTVVIPLVFGIIFESLGWIVGIGIDLSKKTQYSALSYLISLGVSILLMLLLVRPFGIQGVAYGVMIGNLIKAACYGIFSNHVYHLRFELKKPILIVATVFILLEILRNTSMPSTFFYFSITTLVFIGLCFFCWKYCVQIEDKAALIHKISLIKVMN